MAFNLKKVLKALLFSSSQPITVKDIQTAFSRFHDQAVLPIANLESKPEDGEFPVSEPAEMPADEMPAPANDGAEVVVAASTETDEELYQDVPSLITAAQIREAMDELAAELRASNDIYLLIDGANGYRLVTHPRFARWIRILRDEPAPVKLTQSALETLAIIAYRQPVTRGDMEDIRGVTINSLILKQLEDRNWVEVIGHRETVGRPALYATTKQFLDDLGLASLDQLPMIETPAQQGALIDALEHAAEPAPAAPAIEAGEPPSPPEDTAPSEAPAEAPSDASPDEAEVAFVSSGTEP